MAVLLTVSETLDGAAVTDALAGGGTGVDLGSVVNNQYAPITDKASNTGAMDLYIRHDAGIDPITEVGTFIQEYGVGTGFTYGGANTAADDYTSMKNLGNSSGGSKNNADGNSGGLWIDMNWDVSTVNQFDWTTNGIGQGGDDSVAIYGDNLTDGIDLASAFTMDAAAMVVDSTGETAASAPVDGTIGKALDTVYGTNAHCKLRAYLPDSHSTGGVHQWEWVIKYSFTA